MEPCWLLFSMFFSLLLRIDFLFVFGSFWNAILGRFWSPNRIKMRICDYLIFIGFLMFFNVFCVSKGVMFVLFRFFFRFVFGIDFLLFFGSILWSFREAFGSPTWSFLASIFGIDF